ncbi:tetratricopeptide repeat protein [Melioribacteraceae bacterium 4301-Me]|uniref:tetratricopeptide repeat protein n=1 Tax=Pyranulibacter aquaticus TaxID=3163344 RepID=UPI003598E03E
MKTKLFLLQLIISSLVIASIICAQSLDELLSEGDQFADKFENEKALAVFQKAEKLYPDNWEVTWRISKAYVDIAEKMPNKTSEEENAQLAVYQKALDYAEKAVKLGPDKANSYVRRAIANGRIALFKGVFSVAGVVNSVRDDCLKAIQLGNGGNFVQAIAHYVLARTHAKASEKWKPARSIIGLGWADNEVALKEYKKAIELYPEYIMFYVDYAVSLGREDKYKEAKAMLNKALTLPIKNQEDPKKLEEAKSLLNKWKNE